MTSPKIREFDGIIQEKAIAEDLICLCENQQGFIIPTQQWHACIGSAGIFSRFITFIAGRFIIGLPLVSLVTPVFP
jgi:hypothetical protein